MNKKQEALKEMGEAVEKWRGWWGRESSHGPGGNELKVSYDAYISAKDEKCPACDYWKRRKNRSTLDPCGAMQLCPECGRPFDEPEAEQKTLAKLASDLGVELWKAMEISKLAVKRERKPAKIEPLVGGAKSDSAWILQLVDRVSDLIAWVNREGK